MHAQLWFDGACSGNPGPMGGGAVLQVDGREEVLSVPLGRGTNNEAEYHGLLIGLEEALKLGASSVTVHGDSQLVLRHLDGSYKVKAANLRPLFEQARGLLARFEAWDLKWVPRAQNVGADEAARRAVEAL